MTNWLTINPLFPLWAIMLILTAMLCFLWIESRRRLRFKVLRIVAQLLMIVALAGILLRPSTRKKRSSDAALLLTSGYSKQVVDSIIQKQGAIPLYQAPGALPYPNSQVIGSYHELSEYGNHIKFITGEGLPSFSLKELQNRAVNFLPAPTPDGIVELQVPETATAGKACTIEGVIKSSGEATLRLSGPGGAEDSVAVKAKGLTPFALSFTPKEQGKYLYTLQIIGNKGALTEGRLPISVREIQKMRILFLQYFPNFEMKYLKNFLAEQGHALTVRQQVSKTNFRYEYANTPKETISHLSPSWLSSFDLVLIDSDMLDQLGSAEQASLKRSVKDGLGVLILFNNVPSKVKSLPSFASFHFQQSKSDTIHIKGRKQKYVLPIQPELLTGDPSLIAVNKINEKILAGYIYNEAGKIAIQSARETFSLLLRGEKEDYASLWSPLLEQTARDSKRLYSVKIKTSFPFYTDEPIYFSILTSSNQSSIKHERIAIPLREDVTVDGLWHGQTWAGKVGWSMLTTAQDSILTNFYVSEKTEWRSLRFANQIKENSLYFMSNSQFTGNEQYKDPVPPILFYCMFLLSAGFLWLAPKL